MRILFCSVSYFGKLLLFLLFILIFLGVINEGDANWYPVDSSNHFFLIIINYLLLKILINFGILLLNFGNDGIIFLTKDTQPIQTLTTIF